MMDPSRTRNALRQPGGAVRRGGFTWLELAVVLAIIALLAYFACTQLGTGTSATGGTSPVGQLNVSAAQEIINVAAKNFAIATSPIIDCSKAAALTADVTAAQTKINDAARDYPADYAANKAAIERTVNTVNQNIAAYNASCGSAIPTITLPP